MLILPICNIVVDFTNLIRYLMANGINIDAEDNNGWTSLHLAARLGKLATLKL